MSFINIDDDVARYVAMGEVFDKISGLSDKHQFELLPFAVVSKVLNDVNQELKGALKTRGQTPIILTPASRPSSHLCWPQWVSRMRR